jgi:HlyD family secretion protein
LLVPRTTLRETGQLTGVFVMDSSSRARLRLVMATGYDTDRLEILSGIEPGERVVVSPGTEVTDGTPVEVRS